VVTVKRPTKINYLPVYKTDYVLAW